MSVTQHNNFSIRPQEAKLHLLLRGRRRHTQERGDAELAGQPRECKRGWLLCTRIVSRWLINWRAPGCASRFLDSGPHRACSSVVSEAASSVSSLWQRQGDANCVCYPWSQLRTTVARSRRWCRWRRSPAACRLMHQ